MNDRIYSLELFHGPTLAFKDVGARFMARLLQYFIRREGTTEQVNVLVATSGDTGSAVANGFLGVEGIHVYVLYPKGKVSPIQECQFTTLGQNITAIEVDGVFDDCQRLVKSAFMDEALNKHMKLTSANSINVARFLPQAFYYFNAYARMKQQNKGDELVVCVPSGNFGNICAALFGKRMGLPVKRFIAANNANDVFYQYLQTGIYSPKASIQTLANAMDVGDPSNFARIIDLYSQAGTYTPEETHRLILNDISGCTYTDDQIRESMRQCYGRTAISLILTEPVVSVHLQNSYSLGRQVCSARRPTLPNSRRRSTRFWVLMLLFLIVSQLSCAVRRRVFRLVATTMTSNSFGLNATLGGFRTGCPSSPSYCDCIIRTVSVATAHRLRTCMELSTVASLFHWYGTDCLLSWRQFFECVLQTGWWRCGLICHPHGPQ